MNNRTLVLRREQLVELCATDLVEVAGAASQPGATCACPDNTYYCITGTAMCHSRIICS
jgi:hypothetical protein